MKAVIMAGGKGTRIAGMYPEIPKSMIPLCGKPVLEYQIETLRRHGIEDIILCIGHLGKIIEDYFGDGSLLCPKTNKPFGVNIRYIREDKPLGSGGALKAISNILSEDFLLINGDIVFDISFSRLINFHKTHNAIATILTHPNTHPYDSGVIVAKSNGLVTNWIHKEEQRKWYKNRVNAGIHVLSPVIFSLPYIKQIFEEQDVIDLDRDILGRLIQEEGLFAYDSPEYVKDMGTPQRLLEVTEDLKNGRISMKNLEVAQKAVFLDRDGTINKYVGFLRKPDEFELLPNVAEAIQRIHHCGYLVIVVTNQPVIARGEVTFEQLEIIHNKMETLLGQAGAFVDGIYFCPHHPDKGFSGEISELKIQCECRKPSPGMILAAAKDFHIDLSHSWMVGDNKSDIEAGMRAGCMTALLTGDTTKIGSGEYKNLLEFSAYLGC